MPGNSFLIMYILPFLLVSGGLGFLLAWALKSGGGTKAQDRYLALYQNSERARKESEDALEQSRVELDALRAGNPAALAPAEVDPAMIRQIEQLTAERDELRAAQMAENPALGEVQANYSELQERYNQLDHRYESLQAELSAAKQAAANAVVPVAAVAPAGVDAKLVAEMRDEIDDLRLKVARTTSLEMQVQGMTQERDLLEKELIRVRNAGVSVQRDDEEKKALQAQIEKLQREIIAISMSAESTGANPGMPSEDRSELIALRQHVPNLEAEVKELHGQKQSLLEQLKGLQTQVTSFQIAAEEVPALRQKIAELQMASAQTVVASPPVDTTQLEDELQQARMQLEVLKAQTTSSEEMTKAQQERDQALKDLESTRKAATAQLEPLRAEKDRLQATLSQVHVDQHELLSLRQERERTHQELISLRAQAANAVSPEATAELTQLRTERDRLREDRIALSRQRDQMQAELTQASDQVGRLQAAISELEGRPQGPSAEQLQEMETLRGSLRQYEAERDHMRSKVDRAEGMAIESATIIANLESQLEAASRQPVVDPEVIERAEILEQHARKLQQERDELRARSAALESLLGTLHGQRIQLEQQVTSLQAQVEQLKMVPAAPVLTAPVYAAPVPVAPVSVAPIPSVPVEVAPVYVAPVEVAPLEVAPVYVAPAVEAPVARPVYEAEVAAVAAPIPVAPAWAAEVPVVQAPVVQAPVVQAPVVQPAAYERPAAQAPGFEAAPTYQAPTYPASVTPPYLEVAQSAPPAPTPVSVLFPEDPTRVPVPAVTPGETPPLIEVPKIEGDFTPVFAPEIDEEPIPVTIEIEPEPEPEPKPEPVYVPEVVMPGVFAGASLAAPLPEVVAEPVRPAEYVRPKPTEFDELEEIIGIGPVARQVLNDMGITTFKRVALMTQQDMDRVSGFLENFRERVVREKWREQAKVLHRMKYGRDL